MAEKPGTVDRPKVFGIGFQKTGTTTLGIIFDRLGYRTAGYRQFREFARREGVTLEEIEAEALRIATDYDAFQDTPWPILYQSLDRAFPGSKFVHVIRDPEAWIGSAVENFDCYPNAIHQVIYGVPYPRGHEDVWLARYNRHNQEVRDYFAGRPDDFLSLRLEDGGISDAVCEFLGEARLGKATPKANTRMKRRLNSVWWRVKKRL